MYGKKIITKNNIQNIVDLTPIQKGMLFLYLMNKESKAYIEQIVVKVKGELKEEDIKKIWRHFLSSYDCLRTIFKWDKLRNPVQIILKEIDLPIYKETAREDYTADLERIKARELDKGIDLTREPYRICLLKNKTNETIMILTYHHILWDGWSNGILIDRLKRACEELIKNKEISTQIEQPAFSEYIKLIKNRDIDKERRYWEEYLWGYEQDCMLYYDGSIRNPNNKENKQNQIQFSIEGDEYKRLKEICIKNKHTMAGWLHAGLGLTLNKYSGNNDIIFGSTVSGRNINLPDIEKMVGLFINTLPMRISLTENISVCELIKKVEKDIKERMKYEVTPLSTIKECAGIKGDDLFDIILAYENYPMDKNNIDGVEIKILSVKEQTHFGMNIVVLEGAEDKINITINYKESKYSKSFIKTFSKHYKKVILDMIKYYELKTQEIGLLNEEKKQEVIVNYNDTKVEYDRNKTIVELFEEQVYKTPNNIAVLYKDKQLTYSELNKRANSLARQLRSRGVTKESRVALMVEKSLEMIIGIIAIIKAGGGYVPIDPSYPSDRIKYMLSDSSTNILLTQEKLKDRIKFQGEILDLQNEEIYKKDTANLRILNKSTDLLYVIYTSGSTGDPKGVMVEHRSLVNFLYTMYDKYNKDICAEDNCLSLTSISFDVSIAEMFLPLVFGGKLVLFNYDRLIDIIELSDLIIKEKITFAYIPPTILVDVCNLLKKSSQSLKLNKMLVGVEPIKDYVLEEYLKLNRKMRIINGYGPTETTICATMYDYKPKETTGENVPIGKPLNNTQIYILDKGNNPVPIGVTGELCVSGDGLAREYLNKPDLTQDRFVENPFKYGERMYRTGDLARWLHDGNIEFLGRIDNQVKIRGYRIELREIENALLKHEGIKEAVVIARKGKNKNNYICGYIIANEEITIIELRHYLENKLPQYMIPTYFVSLKKMPLTPSGKIDKKALPEPNESVNSEIEYEAPRNEVEQVLVDIWGEALSANRAISINDNFLEIGGDSIKAIQIVSQLQKYDLKLEVKKIFEYPTIKQLSYYVKDIGKIDEQGEIRGNVYLTPVQRWFFDENMTDKHHWNQSVMLYREEGFQEEIIKKAFNEIMEHHDALRMIYEENEEEIKQINKGIKDSLLSIEINDITEENYEKAIEERAEKLQSSIDLNEGPLVKVGLFKTNIGDYLLIVIHHLVIDGVSWRIILEDFTVAYEQLERGKVLEMPRKTTSFKEWVKRIEEYGVSNELLKEKKYWANIESENILPLPRDNQSIENKMKNSNSICIKLSREETENLLKEVNKAYNTEINDILLSALGLTINQWAGRNKILIELEGHGREEIIKDVDITRTVGWFTSQYPVIINIEKSNDIAHIIKNTKEILRQIPNKGIGYGILKYMTPLQYKEELSFNLMPEICFNYLGQFDSEINNRLFKIANISKGNSISGDCERQYTLDIVGIMANQELNITVNYNTYEYREQTIIDFIEKYKLNLQRCINHCMNREDVEKTLSDYAASDLDELEVEDIFDYLESM